MLCTMQHKGSLFIYSLWCVYGTFAQSSTGNGTGTDTIGNKIGPQVFSKISL